MDKKYIEREKAFNKKEYDKEYRKTHYRQFAVNLPIDVYNIINDYCTNKNMTKADLLKNAVFEYIDKH